MIIPSFDAIQSTQYQQTPLQIKNIDFENNLLKKFIRLANKAIVDFSMIKNDDRIMVCLSGGKDSYTLLDVLMAIKQKYRASFNLIAVNLDQKQPGFPEEVLPDYLKKMGIPFHIESRDTYSIIKKLIPEGEKTCSLCSRLRRGNLYRLATELGATKIALGHHRNDILETFLLNLFFAGTIKSMPPKLQSDDGKHIVIRPLAYINEEDIVRYSTQRCFPIIPCNLCGNQGNLKRAEMKLLLKKWQIEHPERVKSLFTALFNVKPSHLLDQKLFPFNSAVSLNDQTKI